MRRAMGAIFRSQQLGLVLVVLVIGVILTIFAGNHERNGVSVNNFLNADTLITVLKDTSVIAMLAVGMTTVIITAGIDLSVGSVYALAGVLLAITFRGQHEVTGSAVLIGLLLCLAVGAISGTVNGVLITGLGVHPFIVTLGTMLIFRGLAFVSTKGNSILVPDMFSTFAKASLGLEKGLHPVPAILMLILAITVSIILTRTVFGRHIFAIGGNVVASKYSGLPIRSILIRTYLLCGLCAGLAAFLGVSYYGSASSGDGDGYELYAVAAAVVGGASLSGGRGNAISAMLGALVIALMRQAVNTLKFDQNYERIIIGSAIIAAVVLDRLSAQAAAKRSVTA
ncbi:MAG: ABC transporter permease [Armatimonadetes bacterium]|nr:ABC transporter permease [Armatimonadota bacterium]